MNRKITYYIVIGLLLFTSKLQAQVNHKVTFANDYTIEPVELADGNTYSKIKISDTQYLDSVGFPSLPVKYVRLLIPANCKASGITQNKAPGQTKKIDHQIVPSQYPEPIGYNEHPKGFVEPDNKTYNSETPYPLNTVEIVEQGSFRGNCIVTLAIYPFQYSPAKNELTVFPTVDFTLNYSSSGKKTSTEKIEVDMTSLTGKVLKSIVENPDDIKEYGVGNQKKSLLKSDTQETGPSLKSVSTTNTTTSITLTGDYVIVTSEALAPYFNDFMAWKKRKGVDIELVTIEAIYQSYPNGDLVSGINDNAGKLRQFLSDAYDNGDGIDYALLAGDQTIIPIRYGYVQNNSTDSTYITPTDLYFSEFDGDWEEDPLDTRYGEPSDGVQFIPEIFVGRIMVTNEAEIKNWTKKVKAYELNPGNGDPSYLTKAFFTQSDQLQQYDQANYILTRIPWISASNRKVFEEQGGYCTSIVPPFPTGSDIINEFNNHYGLCSFMGHGRPCAVGVSTYYVSSEYDCSHYALQPMCADNTKYKITAFDNGESGCGTRSESGNGFDNMTNTDYPSIYYSISCTTMPFDDYEHINSASERNMGESYTCISAGGGPNYLGNTRDGIVDYSYLLFEKFINAIKDSSLFNIGIAEAKSKMWYINRELRYSHNLLGCPETELWTAIPTTFGSASVSKSGTTVSINTGGVDSCTICLTSALDNGRNCYRRSFNASSCSFTGVTEPYYYITIDKHNKIPKTINPTTVLIEHRTLSTDCYLNCETVSAGYNVDTSDSDYGNVVIESGTSVTFDATGNITLAPGFEVQLGAVFEAK